MIISRNDLYSSIYCCHCYPTARNDVTLQKCEHFKIFSYLFKTKNYLSFLNKGVQITKYNFKSPLKQLKISKSMDSCCPEKAVVNKNLIVICFDLILILSNWRYKLSLISAFGFLLCYFSECSSHPGRSMVLISLRTRLINNAMFL